MTICNLDTGAYSVTVTDTTGVGVDTIFASTVITQPAFLLVGSIDSIQGAICQGDSNGLVNLSVSGGTLPYSFLWSNGDNTQNIAGLPEDTYTVTITDANGCTFLDTAVVPLLGGISILLDSIDNPLCNNDSTGAIAITVPSDTNNCSSSVVRLNEFLYRPGSGFNNGTDPNTGEYIELIGPPGTDISCYVLADGDWTLTIPPGTVIPSDGFFTIGNDAVWGAGTFDLDAENCGCFTDGAGGQGLLILTDGGETISLFDGTGTFIDGVVYGSPSAGNQPFGSTFTTVGLTGCVSSVTIPAVGFFSTAPGGLLANTALVRDPDGSGNWVPQVGGSLNGCNRVSGGTNANSVTYLWSTGDTTQDVSGLAGGNYTVTVSNNLGCTDTASFTVNAPAALTVLDTLTNIACMGDSTGSIDLTVSGGVAPYTFVWDNGATSEDLDSLTAGTYCGTVTEDNGCTAVLCATLTEDSLDIPVDTLFICLGDSVQLQVNTTVSDIRWTPAGSLSNDTLVNPFASPSVTTTYVVTGNLSACTMSDSVVVVVAPIDLTATTLNNIACFGDSTGSINTNLAGGGYTYLWSTGATTAAIDSLPAGGYSVTVSNATGCTATATYALIQPTTALAATATVVDVPCASDTTGSIDLSPTGGTAPYTYLWSNGATTQDLINLPVGFYCGTITDDNGCTAVLCDSISSDSISLDIPIDSLLICAGDSVQLLVNTSAASVLWTPATSLDNDTLFNPTASPSTTTTYTVMSQGACMLSDSVVVVVGNANFGLSVTTSTDPNCFGDSTGSITTISTATSLNYLWNTGDTTANLSNVPVGTYILIATDNNSSCTDTLTVSLTEPTPIQIVVDSITPVTCRGGSDGAVASLTVSGGVGSYTYFWDPNTGSQTTAMATNLSSGVYSITVIDANGCTAIANGVFVPQNTAIDSNEVSIVAIDSLLDCDLSPSGTLAVATTNNYNYLWSNGTTSQQADNLAAGAYSVTVSNNQGCSLVLMDTITAPFVPSVFPFIEQFGNASSTGVADEVFDLGAGNDQTSQGVQYSWTVSDPNAVVADPLEALTTVSASTSGTYTISLLATANDASACQDTGSVTLTIESIFSGMPTAFTPNGDGINDFYRPIGLSGEDVQHFVIYNRWGQIVYRGDDLENDGWDGRFQGKEQPTEEYIFVLEYRIGNSAPQVRRGGFTLVR